MAKLFATESATRGIWLVEHLLVFIILYDSHMSSFID